PYVTSLRAGLKLGTSRLQRLLNLASRRQSFSIVGREWKRQWNNALSSTGNSTQKQVRVGKKQTTSTRTKIFSRRCAIRRTLYQPGGGYKQFEGGAQTRIDEKSTRHF